jgi:hypothetical protein
MPVLKSVESVTWLSAITGLQKPAKADAKKRFSARSFAITRVLAKLCCESNPKNHNAC